MLFEKVTQLGLRALPDVGDVNALTGDARVTPAAMRRFKQREHTLEAVLPRL